MERRLFHEMGDEKRFDGASGCERKSACEILGGNSLLDLSSILDGSNNT
jgi:hypothetical protein